MEQARWAWAVALRTLAIAAVIGWAVAVANAVGSIGTPFAGFRYNPMAVVWVFQDSDWNGHRRGIESLDIVRRANDQPIASAADLDRLVAQTPIGTPITYDLIREGVSHRITVETQAWTIREFARSQLPLLFLGAIYLAVGIVPMWLRPCNVTAQAFFLSNLAIALMMFLNPDYTSTRRTAWLLDQDALMVGAGFLAIALTFPQPPERVKRHPYLLLLLALPAVILGQLLNPRQEAADPGYFRVFVWWTFGCLFVLLGRCLTAALARAGLDRLRARAALLGLALASVPILLSDVAAVARLPSHLVSALTSLGLVMMLFFPISLAYAIVQHRMFEIEVFIKRTVVYAVVVALLTGIYFASLLVVRVALETLFPTTASALANLIATSLVTLLFVPVRARVDALVVAAFFRAEYDFSHVVADFTRRAQEAFSAPRLLALYREHVGTALHPAYLALLVASEEGRYVLAEGWGLEEREVAPLAADDRAVAALRDAPGMVSAGDLGLEAWPDGQAIALSFKGELLGIVLIGPRRSGEAYRDQDVRLLMTLSHQLAVRLKSAVLFNHMEELVEARTSELARALSELQAAYRDLQRLGQLKANLVDAVSHDLRTPLTAIKGYAEFLEEEIGGPLSPAQQGFLAQIQSGIQRLERLVNDLLDYARIEAGTFKLSLEDANLALKIGDMVESFRPQAEASHIQLQVEVPTPLLEVRMDPNRIEQVLGNLIGNALKFTPAGGAVWIRAFRDGESLRCEVQDTGEGIAPEDFPRLFQRFGQTEKGSQKRGGTGLGLSISKSIVEAHGGRIGVASEPGRGSLFWFTLPAPQRTLASAGT